MNLVDNQCQILDTQSQIGKQLYNNRNTLKNWSVLDA